MMRSKNKLFGLITIALLSYTMAPFAQGPNSASSSNLSSSGRLHEYVLGPGDDFTILGVDIDEIANKSMRIPPSGDINLPLGIGRVHAAGLTVAELEEIITERLKVNIRRPEIAISLTQLRSQPVSVTGFVRTPGRIQLEGKKSLIEVLSLAGGRAADAGNRIVITRKLERGEIPLPSARLEGDHYVADVDVRAVENGTRPGDNIQILQDDVIHVDRVDLVYVMGEVKRSGAFALTDRKSISIIEALARAEGTTPTASKKNAKILRPVPGSEMIEIAINVEDVLKGKAKDAMLMPEDILFIPDSLAKGAFRQTLNSLIQLSTGLIIYH